MYRLPFIIILLFYSFSGHTQNPHGETLKIDCASCHSPEAWTVAMDTLNFNHDTISFQLIGLHKQIDCKLCHESLKFDQAPSDCIACHDDVHSMSVGNDCMRCHDSDNWLVDEIPELHEQNGFPLLGGHASISCVDCHFSETHLRFDRIGNDCIVCHQGDYTATLDPNHEAAGFSENCLDCHDPMANNWDSDGVLHDFFPLTLGHDIQDCKRCHPTDNFSDASAECISCHQNDYDTAISPDHQSTGIATDCIQCHTTNPDWKPAEFLEHDGLYFPIYSGSHRDEWNSCMDCHLNDNDFSQFSCTICHNNPDTDDDHDEVPGYVYEDNACLACHPTGEEDSKF